VLQLVNAMARGGTEQLLLDIVRNLDMSAFEVDIAYLDDEPTELVHEFAQAGCSTYWLHGHGRLHFGWVTELRHLVRHRRIDLVHAHFPYSAVGARVGFALGGPPVLYTEHGTWRFYRDRRLVYWSNLLTYGLNAAVLAVSGEVARSIQYPRPFGFLHMPPVRTLYHGIDVKAVEGWRSTARSFRREFNIGEHASVIGSVANFRAVKGHRYLPEAFAHVREQVPDAILVLVGRGQLEPQLRTLADRLGLDGSVVFTGYREHAAKIVAAFDVFALPSLNEGLPIALLEALALGKPCVATAVGGVPEIVTHGVHASLVEPGDGRALATALTRLLRDDSLRQRYASAALERAAAFDVRSTVRALEEIYIGLGQGHAGS
jgi:glycosyltransferase involved in cell wall biosynthesis